MEPGKEREIEPIKAERDKREKKMDQERGEEERKRRDNGRLTNRQIDTLDAKIGEGKRLK